MLTHERVWAAIDKLAKANNLSPSALARKAGMDSTAFNPQKRTKPDGQPRWLSMGSISKILKATGVSWAEFSSLIESVPDSGQSLTPSKNSLPPVGSIPLLGLAEAGAGGFFDDASFPHGQGWEQIQFPNATSIYALQVSGDSMLPLYRDGDIIIVNPDASIRKGDRVVVKTTEGEVMAKQLVRKTSTRVELLSLNPAHEDRIIQAADIEWIARIEWASQ